MARDFRNKKTLFKLFHKNIITIKALASLAILTTSKNSITRHINNPSGFTNNLGIKGNLNNLSYLIQGSMVDNKDFETPKEKVESTYYENKDFKLGLGYESKKFISDFRFNYSKTKVGIPHGEEDHDEHGDEDHEDDG